MELLRLFSDWSVGDFKRFFPQDRHKRFNAFDKQFGAATRHGLPFTHTGIVYRDTKRGRTQEQDEFCQKPYPLTKDRARQESSKLTPMELTGFRAILGGLLWLCQTRLDLICEVVSCQQHVAEATIKHLKVASSVVTKAKKYSSDNIEQVGLFFPPLKWPLKELSR